MHWLLLTGLAHATTSVDLWVTIPDDRTAAQVREIGLGFTEQRRGRAWRMDGDEAMTAALDHAGIHWVPAVPDPTFRGSVYHEPDDMVAALDALAEAWPERAERVDLGWSVEGRVIAGLRIGQHDAPETSWRILGAHHGDELSSAELALAVAQDLLERDGADPAVTALLDTDEVWVVPQVNPDGVAARTRYNGRGIDLNRNYDYQWSDSEYQSGDEPFSEPETRDVRVMADWSPLGAGLSMHSGETNLGWVWNYSTSPTVDANLLEDMAGRYADACDQDGFWITDGGEWYITHGDTNDWSYGRRGILDFTLEVSSTKTPPPDQLPDIISAHLPAVRAWLTWPTVLHGQVVDASSGVGLPATVQVGDWPLLTGPQGHFGRPVADGGPVTLQVSAPGYETTTVTASAEEDALVSLEPRSLVQTRPTPGILSRSGDGHFSLDLEADTLTLLRAGHDPVQATQQDDRWVVDPQALSPGPWSLQLDERELSPRAIFIGERDTDVQIDQVLVSTGGIQIDGTGFGAGSRAWALWGTDRVPIPLTVLEQSTASLILDPSPLAAATSPVDLVIVSSGHQLAALDILGEPAVDTAEPLDTGTADTGSASDDSHPLPWTEPSACGCGAPLSSPGWFMLVGLAALTRRSRRCSPRSSR